MPKSRKFQGVVVALAAVTILLGALLGPQQQKLGPLTSGDAELAQRVRAVIDYDAGFQSLAVAEVTRDQITIAGLGDAGGGQAPTGSSPFETGSIAKTFVGAAFSDAIARGEVSPEDRLGKWIPELADAPAGAVTLQSLAQHTSGLPSIARVGLPGWLASVTNRSPYLDTDVATMIEQTRTVKLTQPPSSYSNLATSLLAEALVRASGASDWPTLVKQRVLDPTGLNSTAPISGPAQLPSTAVQGYAENGLTAPRWYGSGYQPAGSMVITTVDDLARYAQALLAGEVSGAEEAMKPTAPYGSAEGSDQIGRFWITSQLRDRSITWHSGETGGFSTMLVIDREKERAVVVLGNSTRSVGNVARRLISGSDEFPTRPDSMMGWLLGGIGLFFSILALSSAIYGKHRAAILSNWITGVAGSLIALAWGPWSQIGGWAFGVVLAAMVLATLIAALRWRGLAWHGRWAWLSWVSVGVNGVFAALVLSIFLPIGRP